MKRGAIELSTNFIVIIIISIVIVGSGLLLFTKMKSGVQEYTDSLNSQTEDQLKALMLNSNEVLTIYPQTVELDPKGGVLIGIGVNNLEVNDTKLYLVLEESTSDCKFYSSPSATGRPCDTNEFEITNNYGQFGFNISGKSQKTLGVLIKAKNVEKGEYVFKVKLNKYMGNSGYQTPTTIAESRLFVITTGGK